MVLRSYRRWALGGGAAFLAAALGLGVAGFAGASREGAARMQSALHPGVVETSPASLTASSGVTGHFLYVVVDHAIDVYDIDDGHRFVQKIDVPPVETPRGVAMSPVTKQIYISYGGRGNDSAGGWVLAYDLLGNRIVWQRSFAGIDSIAVTPDGKTLYVPAGEVSGSGTWQVLDAATGATTGTIEAGKGAHNTIVGLDGKFVYLAGVEYPYLDVASTKTNTVVEEIGPLRTGGRPFTLNGAQTIAYTTAHDYLGFQVDSITTGKVLYTTPVPGFTWDPNTYKHQPTHGISLSPDEHWLYLIDTPNEYVHVFDVSGVPQSEPRDVEDIKLAHPVPYHGKVSPWLLHSRDGRFVYVERSGDVIDTATYRIVAYLDPMRSTASSIEIDWSDGQPVATTTRHAVRMV